MSTNACLMGLIDNNIPYIIYAFQRSMLTDKKQRGSFKALDLKTVFSDFCGQCLICELILALASLWLLVNSIKKEKSQRETSD